MKFPLIAKMLRNYRETWALSLRQAGEQSGVPFSTLSRIERGQEPTLTNLVLIAEWLDISVAVLLQYTHKEPNENSKNRRPSRKRSSKR